MEFGIACINFSNKNCLLFSLQFMVLCSKQNQYFIDYFPFDGTPESLTPKSLSHFAKDCNIYIQMPFLIMKSILDHNAMMRSSSLGMYVKCL